MIDDKRELIQERRSIGTDRRVRAGNPDNRKTIQLVNGYRAYALAPPPTRSRDISSKTGGVVEM